MKRSGKKSVKKSHQESHKQTSSQEFVTSKQEFAASGSGSDKTQKQASKQESAASSSVSKQESAASGSGSTKTQKQTSKQESAASVVPSSLYSQQSRMVSPIRNVTVHRELTPITHTAEPYRSNVHRELTPITCTAEPYRSNIHRELTPITRTTEPYRSNVCTAEPYRRESTPIIREPYSSNWTRDVNEENVYLRERIDELNWQLDNANGELHDLRLDVSQLQSYNNILSQKNDGLRHRHSSDLQDIEFEEDQ
ncbi:hypothetical protein C1646_770633 [Rhizophagus diaphanus]|nr:hypothetical protein C1646_770633 [Rhizophagus diaphanus] [Rhizophagus sp. MUCL 43196]